MAAKRRPPVQVSLIASGIVAPMRCGERSSSPLQSRASLGANYLDVALSPRLLPAKMPAATEQANGRTLSTYRFVESQTFPSGAVVGLAL